MGMSESCTCAAFVFLVVFLYEFFCTMFSPLDKNTYCSAIDDVALGGQDDFHRGRVLEGDKAKASRFSRLWILHNYTVCDLTKLTKKALE